MRFTLGLCLAASLAFADPSGAVPKRYDVHFTTIAAFNTQSPQINKVPPAKDGSTAVSVAILDDSESSQPVLKRLALISEMELTSHVPGLSGFIFLSRFRSQGPGKKLSFTGTGSTATTIAWGLVTGWTITGGFWCHSSPSFICTYAAGKDLATVDFFINSPAYDLGTWTFHGTGFTSVPYVNQLPLATNMTVGNAQYLLRGRLAAALVPAVPVLGVALLGASLPFAGARLSRRE